MVETTIPVTDVLSKGHILFVDDDAEILGYLSSIFEKNGYVVSTAKTVSETFDKIKNKPDIIVLDVMLPDGDGVDLCRKIREKHDIPVIILSAVDNDMKKVLSYEFGAYQYTTKPCNAEVLMAQVKSTLKFANNQVRTKTRYIQFDQWTLDIYERNLVNKENVIIELSKSEYDLIMILIENNCQIVSRDEITKSIYNRPYSGYDRVVDITIGRLRKKIELNTSQPKIIKTVHNLGYIMTTDVFYVDSLPH